MNHLNLYYHIFIIDYILFLLNFILKRASGCTNPHHMVSIYQISHLDGSGRRVDSQHRHLHLHRLQDLLISGSKVEIAELKMASRSRSYPGEGRYVMDGFRPSRETPAFVLLYLYHCPSTLTSIHHFPTHYLPPPQTPAPPTSSRPHSDHDRTRQDIVRYSGVGRWGSAVRKWGC